MDEQRTPAEALALVEYLVSKGKRANSFENTFPRIHHFKGASGSLKSYLKFLEDPATVDTLARQSNQNVVRRLELIKSYVDDFLTSNPGWSAINEFKYQTFAMQAVEEVPYKKSK